MSHLGLLVNAGRKGSESLWMSSADYLATGRSVPDPEECMVELVRKYIECYGPVSRADIAYWSFLLKKDVDLALEALEKDLIMENLPSGQETFSLGENSRETPEPPSAIILPEFDSLMMGYKDKSRFLSQDTVKKVFGRLAAVNRTILLDGFVAATWKRKKNAAGMIVDVSPLRTLKAGERRSIEEEFATYADYQRTKVSVEFK